MGERFFDPIPTDFEVAILPRAPVRVNPATLLDSSYFSAIQLKDDVDSALRKQACDYWNEYGLPFRTEQSERFCREVKKGRVIELRNTNHSFFKDPKLQDEVARMIQDLLLELNYH